MKQTLRIHGREHLPGGSDEILGRATLNAIIDGMGAVITTGVKGDAVVDRAFTIVAWSLLADVSGDLVVDVWRAPYGSFPPVVGDSITGGNPPTLVGQANAQDTGLVGWDVTVRRGDTFRFNVDSVSAVGRATLALTLLPRIRDRS